MAGRKSMLPPEVKLKYWDAVARCLTDEHGLSGPDVVRAVTAYQKGLLQHKVGDMVYHAPIAETAAGIMNGGYATEQEPSGLMKRTLAKRMLATRKTGKFRTMAKHVTVKGKGGMTARRSAGKDKGDTTAKRSGVKDKGDAMEKQRLSK